MKTLNERVIDWLLSRDTGASSKTLLCFFLGKKQNNDYPHDSGDFGRCYRMLRAIPEFRARLGEAKAISHTWAVLVEHWSELEKRYESFAEAEEGRPKRVLADAFYQYLRDLTTKPSAEDGWVHLGEHISMKVGA